MAYLRCFIAQHEDGKFSDKYDLPDNGANIEHMLLMEGKEIIYRRDITDMDQIRGVHLAVEEANTRGKLDKERLEYLLLHPPVKQVTPPTGIQIDRTAINTNIPPKAADAFADTQCLDTLTKP
jgi:hypothetical protein